MSKWKCEICGAEFENFHAQGFDNKIYCPLCYFKRENQELKKQLDELQTLYNNMFKCHCNRVQVETLLSQQKEFIEWLEKEIKTTQDRLNKYNEKVKNREETDIEYYESIIDERIFDVYEKQLSKYKEIIGGSND